jgi:hypothetical protein
VASPLKTRSQSGYFNTPQTLSKANSRAFSHASSRVTISRQPSAANSPMSSPSIHSRTSTLRRNSRYSNVRLSSTSDHHSWEQKATKKRVDAILKLGKLFRTEEDCIFLLGYLKGFKAFLNVPDFLIKQLCAIITSSTYESGQASKFVP